jgi:hypothetical protein
MALRVRDGNQRHLRIHVIERPGVRAIEASVQCHEAFVGKIVEQGLWQQVDMKMVDVKVSGVSRSMARVLPK